MENRKYAKDYLDLQKLLKNNQTTSVELVKDCLDLIKNDKYNCVLEVNPDALKIAREMDELRKKGVVLSDLHGIPVLIKANINTNDKMSTSAGSVALKDNFPGKDAPIVEKLRKAGAIIAAKTNLAEFANYMANGKMPNGYSSLGGQVICAINPKINPCGSSSGSAVAVSTNICMGAIGTETFGSITCPAIRNQIIGLKPTQGLVNNGGIIPIAHTLDTAGPMTSNVKNAAVLLSAMAEDVYKKDYLKDIDQLNISQIRIGLSTENRYGENTKSRMKYADSLFSFLENKKFKTVKLDKMPATNLLESLLFFEFKNDLNQYLKDANHKKIKSLQDIIDYNNKNAEIALKFGQHTLIAAQEIDDYSSTKKYKSIMKQRCKIQSFLMKLFEEKNIDLIISTSSPNVAVMSGFPIMAIPLGMDKRKNPQGIYIYAKPFEEEKLIKFAYFIEQNFGKICI